MLSAGQPPLEAAPTPQGYAQLQAVTQGQNQSQNQAQAMMEAAGGQDNGQVQSLMDPSRPRNADVDGVVEDSGGGGGGGGLSDQQKQPINLSQVCVLFRRLELEWLVRNFVCLPLRPDSLLTTVSGLLSNARKRSGFASTLFCFSSTTYTGQIMNPINQDLCRCFQPGRWQPSQGVCVCLEVISRVRVQLQSFRVDRSRPNVPAQTLPHLPCLSCIHVLVFFPRRFQQSQETV